MVGLFLFVPIELAAFDFRIRVPAFVCIHAAFAVPFFHVIYIKQGGELRLKRIICGERLYEGIFVPLHGDRIRLGTRADVGIVCQHFVALLNVLHAEQVNQ